MHCALLFIAREEGLRDLTGLASRRNSRGVFWRFSQCWSFGHGTEPWVRGLDPASPCRGSPLLHLGRARATGAPPKGRDLGGPALGKRLWLGEKSEKTGTDLSLDSTLHRDSPPAFRGSSIKQLFLPGLSCHCRSTRRGEREEREGTGYPPFWVPVGGRQGVRGPSGKKRRLKGKQYFTAGIKRIYSTKEPTSFLYHFSNLFVNCFSDMKSDKCNQTGRFSFRPFSERSLRMKGKYFERNSKKSG